MKVKDLKELIKNLPDDMQIVMSSDGEGNSYSPLSGGDYNSVYVPESTWSGNIFYCGWTSDEACMEEEEWQKLLEEPKCLVLYPVN